jgi:hypothetical protein
MKQVKQGKPKFLRQDSPVPVSGMLVEERIMSTLALLLIMFSAPLLPKGAISAAGMPGGKGGEAAQRGARVSGLRAAALKLGWDNLLNGYQDLMSAPPEVKGGTSELESHMKVAMEQLHQLDPKLIPPAQANIPVRDQGRTRQFVLDAVRGHLEKARTVIEHARVSSPYVEEALQNIALAQNDVAEMRGTPAAAGGQPAQTARLTPPTPPAQAAQPAPPARPAARLADPAETLQGITFRNFNGSNGLLGRALSQQLGLSWFRDNAFGLAAVEPHKGEWDWKRADAVVNGAHAQGAEELPCLLGTGWATRTPGKGLAPPKNIQDWEDYVEHLVARYSAPPFNLRYFQIWNEPTKDAGFFAGTDQEFVDLIYLPAAKIIRQHHCFVVFGGWGSGDSLQRFDQVLNYHNTWQWTDILDVHYRDVAAWQRLYNEWVKPGKCRGIWQTEVGFTPVPSLLPDVYLKSLYFALQSGWSDPDQYKLLWFASWGAGADADKCLTKGPANDKVLSLNGQRLATLNDVLGAGPLALFTRFQMQPSLPAVFASRAPAALGFKVGANRTVIALLLDRGIFGGHPSLPFSIHVDAVPQVTELVTASGQRQELHGTFAGGTWHVSVPMQNVQNDCPGCIFTVAYLRIE